MRKRKSVVMGLAAIVVITLGAGTCTPPESQAIAYHTGAAIIIDEPTATAAEVTAEDSVLARRCYRHWAWVKGFSLVGIEQIKLEVVLRYCVESGHFTTEPQLLLANVDGNNGWSPEFGSAQHGLSQVIFTPCAEDDCIITFMKMKYCLPYINFCVDLWIRITTDPDRPTLVMSQAGGGV